MQDPQIMVNQQNAALQNPPLVANQQNNAGALPIIAPNRRGWYPRWWLLAALTCSIVVIVLALLWTPVICKGLSQPGICQFPDLFYPLQVAIIWLFFLALWWPFMAFGIPLVEIPAGSENVIGEAARRMTEFGALRPMILIQGLIAFIIINVMWWLDKSPPIAFALLGMIVFLAHCSETYHTRAENRRNYLIGYGVIALFLFVMQATLKRGFFAANRPPDEWPLLWVETLLMLAAILVGVFAILRRGRQPTQLTAQQAYDQGIDNMATPGNILRTAWPFRRLFPPRPPAAANQNQQPPVGNPDPGAP
ncbi:MAG TPA: hypothetical protein VL485_33440 [Ktedonobacteraceae bacterium]|jgi:hypothetical protein|nr:hypothetical protein [Ktedonobacteraceae bacterium]